VPAARTDTRWSPWRVLQPPLTFTPADLAETLNGGQAFRWNRIAPSGADTSTPPPAPADAWRGTWSAHVVDVRLGRSGELQWRKPAGTATSNADVARYFDATRDYAAARDALPWRADPALALRMSARPTLRILRQPLGEALFGFLCSSTKQIPQIKQICEALAARFGPALPGGLHALPGWPALAETSEAQLRACRLGYRARYIHKTAQRLATHPSFLGDIETLPYTQAREQLTTLPGVGGKIADCVLLFGAGRLEAFPVDTWIIKAMAASYGLTGWPPEHIAHFGRVHFGPAAGLAQQLLFARQRRGN